jgi:hypothetical protein
MKVIVRAKSPRGSKMGKSNFKGRFMKKYLSAPCRILNFYSLFMLLAILYSFMPVFAQADSSPIPDQDTRTIAFLMLVSGLVIIFFRVDLANVLMKTNIKNWSRNTKDGVPYIVWYVGIFGLLLLLGGLYELGKSFF